MDVDPVVQVSLLVGFLLPPVLAFVLQSHWGSNLKNLVAFFACVVASLAVVWAKGELDLQNWFVSGLAVLVAAKVTYDTFWKPTEIAPTIEEKTTVTEPPPP